MKTPLEEAMGLFRQNEALGDGDQEKANLYRGLALLAEGMCRLERELADVKSQMQDGPSRVYQRRRFQAPRRLFSSAITPNGLP